MSDQDPDDWMWRKATAFLDRAEALGRAPYRLGRAGGGRATWEPPVDVFVTSSGLAVVVALPGVEPGRLEVLVQETRLVVRGDRRLPGGLRRAVVQRLEIPLGSFERRVELPQGVFELRDSELRDGCLVVTLLRKEAAGG